MRTIKGTVSWVDVLKPNENDLSAIKKLHSFHPIIIKEVVEPSARSKVERYDDYLFVVFHLPIYDTESRTSRRAEIDFLITKNKVVTVHYENLEQLDALFLALTRDEKLKRETLKGDSLLLVYHIMESIIGFSLRQLRHMEERVGYVAQEIFKHREEELLKEITYIKRDVLDYRLIVKPQEALLESWIDIGLKFWGEKSRIYMRDLVGDHLRVSQNLTNYFQTIEALEQTNAQLLNAATNKIMKRLTALAFLFSLPLYLFFLMGVPYAQQIIDSPSLFWTLYAAIHIAVITVAFLLRKKKIL